MKRACTTPLRVDVDADEAAGGVAVLRHRVDREVLAELRGVAEIEGHVDLRRRRWQACTAAMAISPLAGVMSSPVSLYVERVRAADGRAVDVQVGVPRVVAAAPLTKYMRRRVRGAQRVVHRQRRRLVEARRYPPDRTSRSSAQWRCAGRFSSTSTFGRGVRRADAGAEAQVRQAAGVEAAVGERRIHLQALAAWRSPRSRRCSPGTRRRASRTARRCRS